MRMGSYKSVDAYIAARPKDIATRLRSIRKAIKECAPKAEEKLSYGMPAYQLHGPLVYFAAQQQHIGFYVLPSGIIAFRKELTKYQTSKSTIQLQNDESLPLGLIKKIVRARVKENLAKIKQRDKKK